MEKDFDEWNRHKKILNRREQPPFFHERDIWWCALGVNLGSEQDGTGHQFSLPVLILKKFSRDVLWAVPLTKNQATGAYYYQLKPWKTIRSNEVLSQLRLVSAKRLLRRIPQRVGEEDFDALMRQLTALYIKRSPSSEGVSEANGH